MANTSSDKILARLKGLRAQMRAGEQPLFSIPAIWENVTDRQSNACDLVLTNQRIFGYIYTTFPRERLFFDALELKAITAVSIRQKNFQAMFRELLVSDHQKRIYIRATGKKIEEIYSALRSAIADNVSLNPKDSQVQESQALDRQNDVHNETGSTDLAEHQNETASPQTDGPIYSRQHIRQPLERSPLGITILMIGGLLLEIAGVLGWAIFSNPQMGITLILTGLFAVIIATIARRQRR